MTDSERVVYELIKKSFPSFWSYLNPLNARRRELCDVLVVCDPDIIIFSIKEIEYKDTGRPKVDVERWKRKAIDASSKQVYGAERQLVTQSEVITRDGKVALPFPADANKNIYRVAIALGSKEKVPLIFGDFGKGFVHVFDETSLEILLSELDTISDFLKYLSVKQNWFESGKISISSTEEDLLAFYLTQDCSLPSEPSLVVLEAGLWERFSSLPEVISRKESDQTSYIWDNLIERVYENYATNNYRTPWANDFKELSDAERVVRAMAREDRQMRQQLGASVLDLRERSGFGARVLDAIGSPVRYVVMTADYDSNRELNFKELQARCLVARGLDHSKQIVIGILMELTTRHSGDAVSLCYLGVRDWTPEWQEKMDLYQNELGFFLNLRGKIQNKANMSSSA